MAISRYQVDFLLDQQVALPPTNMAFVAKHLQDLFPFGGTPCQLPCYWERGYTFASPSISHKVARSACRAGSVPLATAIAAMSFLSVAIGHEIPPGVTGMFAVWGFPKRRKPYREWEFLDRVSPTHSAPVEPARLLGGLPTAHDVSSCLSAFFSALCSSPQLFLLSPFLSALPSSLPQFRTQPSTPLPDFLFTLFRV